MAKLRKHTTQAPQTHQQRSAKRSGKSRVPACSSRDAQITSERYPKMSPDALAFARQMRANPHVRAVMRDLADK